MGAYHSRQVCDLDVCKLTVFREDAQKAMEQAMLLDGRTLKVDWADRKPKKPKGKSKDATVDTGQGM